MVTDLPILSDPTYRIESELGSGGGGVVYKAWHTRLQKHVVIKELKRASTQDIETQRNEVEALKNVKSAYLPQVFDFIVENGHVFTVMEFVEGDSLDKLLERGQKFTQQQVVKWYNQLVAAMEAIHKQGVYHRDIKPANIMLTTSGDVCLIDFNAAFVNGSDVRMISRSLGYASPEQYAIFEKYKNRKNAPINLATSQSMLNEFNGTDTELMDDDATVAEHLGNDATVMESMGDNAAVAENTGDDTVLISGEAAAGPPAANPTPQIPEQIIPSVSDGVDWKRSDIYSLGATMHHLLSGVRPPERASEVVSISQLGRFGEGLVYVIEKSMRINPDERFATASILSDVVSNIHKFDTRWKISQSKKITAAVVLPITFALFASSAVFGNSVMAQEKEERYYAAVYDIENGSEPQASYDNALEMFWDRIDPYYAMAKRLWNDGNMDACREYIEENLGNIAEFQAVPEAMHSFGDIYFILGNCYYYQAGEPDYHMAKGYFDIAVRNVTDNPVYFRDYAISLARTGDVTEAEKILVTAKSLNLDAVSLNMLNGEIAFAKKEYDSALDSFDKVIKEVDDDYLRYRAYHTSDEIYKLLGQPELSVPLLSDCLDKIPLNCVPEMTERLADAYVKSGDYDNALVLFEQLAENGVPQFHIMQNLVILMQDAGEFERALEVLEKMSDLFANDYRVPMRKAYLEADRQSTLENESRDYTLTKTYYDEAAELYGQNVKPGENDPEMQQLELLIEQLRDNKWFD